MSDLRRRPSARLLVFDPSFRVLLLHGYAPGQEVPRYWYTPGGALQAGEAYEDAARRELREELAIEADIGPWVWSRRQVFSLFGNQVEAIERFFVVRIEDPALAVWRSDDLEAKYVDAYRWWTAEEVVESDEPFFPSRLGEHLQSLVYGGCPSGPVEVEP